MRDHRTPDPGPDPEEEPGPAPVPQSPTRRRTRVALVTLGWALPILVVVALIAAAIVRVPYVVISPGAATPLDDQVVSITGASTYEHDGRLLYLTVTVSNRDPNLYRWLFASLDPNAAVMKREAVIGCASYAASDRLAVDEMDQSQDAAKAVALEHLGYTVTDEPSRVQVIDVLCEGPSDGALELGDVITSVDGTDVARAEEIRPIIVAHRPGETVAFGVLRGDERLTVDVRLGEHDDLPDAGIVTRTVTPHRFPVDVTIDTARVSGPSAGLAFSLAIVDDLSPGSLTGGRTVAVTGTIADDGSVGPVGGVAQKAVTARRAGARLMLVPKGEEAEARRRAGDMRVVGVATFDDAVRALSGEAITGTAADGP